MTLEATAAQGVAAALPRLFHLIWIWPVYCSLMMALYLDNFPSEATNEFVRAIMYLFVSDFSEPLEGSQVFFSAKIKH